MRGRPVLVAPAFGDPKSGLRPEIEGVCTRDWREANGYVVGFVGRGRQDLAAPAVRYAKSGLRSGDRRLPERLVRSEELSRRLRWSRKAGYVRGGRSVGTRWTSGEQVRVPSVCGTGRDAAAGQVELSGRGELARGRPAAARGAAAGPLELSVCGGNLRAGSRPATNIAARWSLTLPTTTPADESKFAVNLLSPTG